MAMLLLASPIIAMRKNDASGIGRSPQGDAAMQREFGSFNTGSCSRSSSLSLKTRASLRTCRYEGWTCEALCEKCGRPISALLELLLARHLIQPYLDTFPLPAVWLLYGGKAGRRSYNAAIRRPSCLDAAVNVALSRWAPWVDKGASGTWTKNLSSPRIAV
jgi:hypothetical protein